MHKNKPEPGHFSPQRPGLGTEHGAVLTREHRRHRVLTGMEKPSLGTGPKPAGARGMGWKRRPQPRPHQEQRPWGSAWTRLFPPSSNRRSAAGGRCRREAETHGGNHASRKECWNCTKRSRLCQARASPPKQVIASEAPLTRSSVQRWQTQDRPSLITSSTATNGQLLHPQLHQCNRKEAAQALQRCYMFLQASYTTTGTQAC